MTKEEKLKIPRIIVHDLEELMGYFKTDNIDVFKDILIGIQQGFDLELEDVELFEVELAFTSNVLLFTLKRNTWLRELNLLLKTFVDSEEYELASDTKELIDKIKNDV